MSITFNYIRNRIREHSKQDLLQACYNVLDDNTTPHKPIWFVFLLMKWTYLYGGQKYPSKPLTSKRFYNILTSITDFNQEHVSNFMTVENFSKAFHILFSQQFYLQTGVNFEKFACQLRLYNSITGSYDINESFLSKTGLAITDFITISNISWLYINVDRLERPGVTFDGYLHQDFIQIASKITDEDKVRKWLFMLALDPVNPNEKINDFKRNIKSEELQSLERTFFTQYPLQIFNGRIRLIHKSVFNYTLNYYIYDYLKSTDQQFTTEFGLRFEKYVEYGIKEMDCNYISENALKKKLPRNSNLVDYVLPEDNIYIECKAIELQAYPSINPTDELLYNSLKDSLLKAYFKQLLNVSNSLNPNGVNWGVIITYKKLFWSHFPDLYALGKEKFNGHVDIDMLPPENVFLIDLFTWDRIVNIVKDENTSLLKILEIAQMNNSEPKTKKQSFDMHLDTFVNNPLDLSYLNAELDIINNKIKLKK